MSLLADYAAAVWSHSPRTLGATGDDVSRSELLQAYAAAVWSHAPRTLTVPIDGPETIREAVQLRIAGTAAVGQLCGDRVRWGGLPQRDALPAITLDFSRGFGRNLGGADGTSRARCEVSCWSLRYLEAAQLADSLRRRFDGFRGWIGRVEVLVAWCDDELEAHEPPDPNAKARSPWLYRVILPVSISHRLPKPDQLSE